MHKITKTELKHFDMATEQQRQEHLDIIYKPEFHAEFLKQYESWKKNDRPKLKKWCDNCEALEWDLGQYYMAKDELWAAMCRDLGKSEESIICANCFENWLGHRITTDDIKVCQANDKFLTERLVEVKDDWEQRVQESIETGRYGARKNYWKIKHAELREAYVYNTVN